MVLNAASGFFVSGRVKAIFPSTVLAAQWAVIYRKDKETEHWKFSSNGLPEKLAIANMQVHNKIIVVSSVLNQQGAMNIYLLAVLLLSATYLSTGRQVRLTEY